MAIFETFDDFRSTIIVLSFNDNIIIVYIIINMVIAQCYECTSIGFDDEPGGNCSDTHPGGKVMVMMRMVIMMMKMMMMITMIWMEVTTTTLTLGAR